jgi:SM-20-related protein
LNTLAEIAATLGHTGLCIVPDFLNITTTRAVLLDLKALKKTGQFVRAGIGQGQQYRVQDTIRRDEIFWLDELLANVAQQQLWLKINALKQALNRELYLGLKDFEGHYASYPRGGFYTRHRDSFHRDEARCVSVIIYLNPLWKTKDGGQLRVYTADHDTDIAPIAGTLVCFLSHELEHEVLLSHKNRLSFSGWFKT